MKKRKGEMSNLLDININQLCIVRKNEIFNYDVKIHLMEMGIINGTLIKKKKIAPFGEPVVIELRGYELFLQKNEMKNIIVEVC